MLKKIGKKVLPKLKSRCTYVDLTSYIWLATIQEYNRKKKKSRWYHAASYPIVSAPIDQLVFRHPFIPTL